MKKRGCFFFGILSILAVISIIGCKNERQSIIVISGTGTVLAQPDMVQMNISLTNTAPTTSRAQEAVGLMVRQALNILQEAGIEEKNISTASLRFFPEYDWGGTKRVLLGQRAEQVIAFSIDNITAISGIIDRLIQINGIELHQMLFTVKDNTELYARSRELAYQKAREKAEQYAGLSGLKIAKVLMITEDGTAPYPMPMSNRALNKQAMMDFAAETAAGNSGSTVLPTGEMEITSRIQVEFLMK